MNEHEEKFVKSFIVKSRRERYITQLSSKKRRHTIIHRLAHNFDFDEKYAFKIPSSQHIVRVIEKLLFERGAKKTCYIISENVEIDGKELSLSETLKEVVGYTMGTILSCIPGVLVYYESEDIGERYIFYKK